MSLKKLTQRKQKNSSVKWGSRPTYTRTDMEPSEIDPPSMGQSSNIHSELAKNETYLRKAFADAPDVVFHPVTIHGKNKMLFVYIDGVTDTKTLNEVVLRPLLYKGLPDGLQDVPSLSQALNDDLLPLTQTNVVSQLDEVVDYIVKVNIAILVDGDSSALIADLKSFAARSVEEPAAEPTIRGPREGFTEVLRTNTSLLRRIIHNPNLKMDSFTLGDITQTDVLMVYLEGIANQSLLEEVRSRISRIKIDGILESGYIEEMIEDAPFSPFPQIQNTERPDVVVSSLLEGKVAILVDGTPFVLIAPMTFWAALQAAEDSYERFIYTSAVRMVRFFLFTIALVFPSFYVAATTFHPQMLPTNLLLSFASAREPSPFPAVVEALLMETMFEGLREAGLRLPRPVGSAVSIVGALVLGQAAVQAGIISAPMVIVVATTGIASFAIPRYSFGTAFRLLRFPLLILSGILGFYGVAVGLVAIMVHLVNLRSFGVPYLSPIAPRVKGNVRSVLLRNPIWAMIRRPKLIIGGTSIRMPKGQKPRP